MFVLHRDRQTSQIPIGHCTDSISLGLGVCVGVNTLLGRATECNGNNMIKISIYLTKHKNITRDLILHGKRPDNPVSFIHKMYNLLYSHNQLL